MLRSYSVRFIILVGALVLGFSWSSVGVTFAVSEVDLVVNPPPSLAKRAANANPKAKPRDVRDIVVETERGESLHVETTISNVGLAESGPFDVRIFLASRYDGSGLVHEFDVVRQPSVPGKGLVRLSGEYTVPFYPVIAGRSYWLVVEADSTTEVVERNKGNNRQVISTVFVPCDDFKPEEYIDEYLCPKFGEND